MRQHPAKGFYGKNMMIIEVKFYDNRHRQVMCIFVLGVEYVVLAQRVDKQLRLPWFVGNALVNTVTVGWLLLLVRLLGNCRDRRLMILRVHRQYSDTTLVNTVTLHCLKHRRAKRAERIGERGKGRRSLETCL